MVATRADDTRRDRWLARQGYVVVRVSAEEVLGRTPDVVARIRYALEVVARSNKA